MFDWSTFLEKYFPILFGLFVGAMSHLGRSIGDGEMPSAKEMIGYVMQLGLMGLLALVTTKLLGIEEPDIMALVTAIFAISTRDIFQVLKKHGIKTLTKALLRGFGLKVEPDKKD